MSSTIPGEATQAFASLAELVYSTTDHQTVLDAICQQAVAVIPGADHVSISTLAADRTLVTRAASDDVARLMDHLETESGEGPCLDAVLENSVQRDDDIATFSTWPALAELTLSQTSVRGMVGYRLLQGEFGRSAMNVFSDTPGALTAEAASVGTMLAAFSSVALTAAERRADVENLRRGLDSNREIGKAIGLLMAAHQVDADQAFALLRTTSSRMNVKLVDIAARVVELGAD